MQSTAPDVPKSLIPILGRPFIELQLEWLAAQGVREIVLCIGHLGAHIREHVGTGASFGVAVTYVDESEELRGTAGALRTAVDELQITRPFYVLYGDSMLDVSITDVTWAYRVAGLPALMTVFRNHNQWEISNAIFDGKVVTRYEKNLPDPPTEMTFVDYGLLVLDPSVIIEGVSVGEVADLSNLLSKLSTSAKLAGFEAPRRFFEIGSPSGLAELEEHLTSEERSK